MYDIIASHGMTVATYALIALAAGLGWIVKQIVSDVRVRTFLAKLGLHVKAACLEVAQTYTDEIRKASADGTLTDEEKAAAKALAMSKLRARLGWKGLLEVAKVLGIGGFFGWLGAKIGWAPAAKIGEQVDAFLAGEIESALAQLKADGLVASSSSGGADPFALEPGAPR